MVTGGEVIATVIGVLGLVTGGAGWLARRDTKHKEGLEAEIEENGQSIDELDTAFGQLTQRLFGHPEDETDTGALVTRAERVEEAEEEIDSLSDEVQYAKRQAEENGEAIDHLDEQVTEHAHQTRKALHRIEQQLDESLIPEEEGDFLGGGGSRSGDD